MSVQLFGLSVSRGVAIGRAVLIVSSRMDVAHYLVASSEVDAEMARLRQARDQVVQELMRSRQEFMVDASQELAALLDVHLMLLSDESLMLSTKQWIEERHYNAQWALSAQLEVLVRQFDAMEDAYLRERKADVEQVVERLLRALSPSNQQPPSSLQPTTTHYAEDPLVLVANDIAPADMLQFSANVFSGFVTDVGGKTSHTAIVARSMDVAAVVGAREASALIKPDDWVIIDAECGAVIVNPSVLVLDEYRERQRQHRVERGQLLRLNRTPAVTLDGHAIELQANIERPTDAVLARDAGAMGIGLFRSEFLFMNRGGELPGENEQFEAYRAAVLAMGTEPVTIRTVDIGADKPLDRLSANELRHEHTLNPALGLRAIRWSLAEPGMFRQQLRAILRASAFGKVQILLPMITHVAEIKLALQAIESAKEHLRDAKRAFGEVRVGAMIEVPAAALTLPTLLEHLDFISIGTNDLIQYTLAIDRADETVAHLYDPWHPAVLNLIFRTITQGHLAGKHVTVCGEMGGDPAFTTLLLAMGLRSFSMHPSRLGIVKRSILQTDTRLLQAGLSQILSSPDPQETYQHFCAEKLRLAS